VDWDKVGNKPTIHARKRSGVPALCGETGGPFTNGRSWVTCAKVPRRDRGAVVATAVPVSTGLLALLVVLAEHGDAQCDECRRAALNHDLRGCPCELLISTEGDLREFPGP
jgi:hypothetical protein